MLIIAIDITLTMIPLLKIVVEECIEIYHIVRDERSRKGNDEAARS